MDTEGVENILTVIYIRFTGQSDSHGMAYSKGKGCG